VLSHAGRGLAVVLVYPKTLAKYLNGFIISEIIPYWNRPQGLICKGWW
jgi:hypothetical protein